MYGLYSLKHHKVEKLKWWRTRPTGRKISTYRLGPFVGWAEWKGWKLLFWGFELYKKKNVSHKFCRLTLLCGSGTWWNLLILQTWDLIQEFLLQSLAGLHSNYRSVTHFPCLFASSTHPSQQYISSSVKKCKRRKCWWFSRPGNMTQASIHKILKTMHFYKNSPISCIEVSATSCVSTTSVLHLRHMYML